MLGGAGLAAASPWSTGKAAPTAVAVAAKDFSFVLSRSSVPVGTVRFTVVNRGDLAHDFVIAGRKTPLLKPRQKATLDVTFARAGSYAYRCSVPGHAALGMKGVLAVGALKPKPATTTTAPTPVSVNPKLKLTKIGDFQRPVELVAPKGDPNHLFVVEQRGTIQEIVDGQVAPEPFLDIRDRTLEVNERGLLSKAFAPDVCTHGAFVRLTPTGRGTGTSR